MNEVLGLQRLAFSVPVDGDDDGGRSSQSICCAGSTQSQENCCNAQAT